MAPRCAVVEAVHARPQSTAAQTAQIEEAELISLWLSTVGRRAVLHLEETRGAEELGRRLAPRR